MASSVSNAALLVAALLCPSPEGAADSYRCGRRLIQSGDSSADVLRLCGEPRHKDRGQEYVRLNGVRQAASVERWYYKKSSRSLERIVVIYRGKVISIDVGAR
jgi:hypothetical protein